VICESCYQASIPPQICVRVRFASEPIFSKCKHSFCRLSSRNADSQEGLDAIYQSQLAWKRLPWGPCTKSVILRHEQTGPAIEVICRQFQADSPEQTCLFYKDGSGWNWIQTTPYALLTHRIELDAYLSAYTMFYLEEAVNNGSWLSRVFEVAKRHIKVSSLLVHLHKLMLSAGPSHMDCT
jgi:hypothetical protein